MSTEMQNLQERVDALERENARLREQDAGPQTGAPRRSRRGRHAPPVPKTIRKRSERTVMGMPLWEIASGPDPAHGEKRGHARAIFAVGDVADGVFALGGIARGVFCIGGVALGVVTLGGVSLSLLAAMGGVAISPLAFGGVAIGGASIGGAAVGVYAKGDSAAGKYIVSRQGVNPEAVRFFRRWGL
jgi:hypothetical protein